ncbi:MAG: hypothetical protein EUB_01788 [Eubacterium sp.]|uniref:ATP-binding protein n=1 Tax=Eubacterium sp. TaxID=142586 RepID=UPI00306B416C
MKIKTLILTSFGKFKDRVIEVDDGFNLVYGENEAGKSTVQHFIEGMLFGFYKPYRKKRTYSEEFERFKPWGSDTYCGAMVMEQDDGREIRIERDFLKKQDGVKIYDNVTGEDITALYPYDNVTRQNLPLGDLKINSVVYNNTVNIKQMASASDADLAKEVNDRLIELGTAQKEEISLNRVMGYLENKKKSIGNYGQSKSNYGMAVRELKDLERALDEGERVYNVIQKNQKRIQQYKKKIEAAQSKCRNQSEKTQAKTREELKNMREKVREIRSEGEALSSRLAELEKYEDFDTRTYGRLKILQSNLEGAGERIKTLSREIEALESKCQDITGRCNRIKRSLKGLSRNEVQMDYQKYQYALENPSVIEREQEHIEVQVSTLNRVSNGMLILLMVLGAILVLVTAINPGNFLAGAVLVFVNFLGWFLGLGGAALMIYKMKSPGGLEPETAEDMQEEYDEVPLSAVEAILQKYGKNTPEEYEAFVRKAEEIFNRLDKLTMDENVFLTQVENKKKELEEVLDNQASFEMELSEELEEAGVENIEAYNEGCQYKSELEKVRAELAANKRLYDELGGGNMIKVDPDAGEEDNPVIMVAPDGEKIRAREALLAFNQEVSRLQGENSMLISSVSNPVETREKIETLKNQISEYEEDLRACDMALDIFGRLSKETHYDCAPVLNDKIGDVLHSITRKYKEVKIDDKLQVKVVSPENGDLLDIEKLSGGTIDQIYFALRFGVGNVLEFDKSLPFVLDDPFVQYDLARKTEAVRFLWNISQGQQVLLFTCSGDEKRILDHNELSYSGIIL